MIAIYWETVARWKVMRARRDAEALCTPLFLIQAADAASPPMPAELAKKLMNKANPKTTGGMHGMLAVHVGMRVRLLAPLAFNRGLVKGSEGDVVCVAAHPLEQNEVDAAATGGGTVYLLQFHPGVRVRTALANP